MTHEFGEGGRLRAGAGIGKVLTTVTIQSFSIGSWCVKTKDDKYLRVKQAAEMSGIAPTTIRKWGATGKIPSIGIPPTRIGSTSDPILRS